MTSEEYRAALRKLGLRHASKRTATLLGVTVRQCQNLAMGKQAVSPTIARLLAMYLRHGLPDEIGM